MQRRHTNRSASVCFTSYKSNPEGCMAGVVGGLVDDDCPTGGGSEGEEETALTPRWHFQEGPRHIEADGVTIIRWRRSSASKYYHNLVCGICYM